MEGPELPGGDDFLHSMSLFVIYHFETTLKGAPICIGQI